LIVWRVWDWMAVDFLILTRQPVFETSSTRLKEGLLFKSQGCFTSTVSSPVAVSKRCP